MDKLAEMIENPWSNTEIMRLDFGVSAFSMLIDGTIGLRGVVTAVIKHHSNGMSAGDYMLLFIMNAHVLHDIHTKGNRIKNLECFADYGSVT